MATIKVQVTTPGAKAAADSLLRLSAAERKAALEAAGLDRAMKKTGRAGKSASSSMVAGFKNVGGQLVGIASGAAAVAASVRLIRSEFDRLKQLDTGAMSAQQTLADAVGKFLVNNPQTSREDVAAFQSFAMNAGAQLGKGGGVTAFNALIAVRGQTPGASAAAQAKAVETAIGLKTLDPDVDIAAFAANAIKLQESAERAGQKLTMDQAFKTLLFTGSRAGGDVSELAGSMIQLTGAEGIATGNTLKDLLALFAFGTAETGDVTGKPSASTVSSLLSRMQSRPVKLLGTGEEIETFGETGLDKLLNLVERLRAGEFGEGADAAAVVKAISEGGGDVKGSALVSQLVLKLDRFEKTRDAINADRADTDVAEEIKQNLFALVPTARTEHARRLAEGRESEALQGMTREGQRAMVQDTIESTRTAFGISGFEGPFMGGVGVGHKVTTAADTFFERNAAEILAENEAMIARVLAARIMGPEGALGTDDRGMSPGDRMIKRQLRAATTPDEIVDIGAQFNLADAAGGIDELDRRILRRQGATNWDLTILKLADQGLDRDEKLKAELIKLTNALYLNTEAKTIQPEVPINANDP